MAISVHTICLCLQSVLDGTVAMCGEGLWSDFTAVEAQRLRCGARAVHHAIQKHIPCTTGT